MVPSSAVFAFPLVDKEYNLSDKWEWGSDGLFVVLFLGHHRISRPKCRRYRRRIHKYKSTQLILVGRYGDMANIILGVAVCNSKSAEGYTEEQDFNCVQHSPANEHPLLYTTCLAEYQQTL
ncbi:hypothetical protein GQ600_2067 [Phytophthora cactorum]|nr:hypothetical protein GQ600_2067 [Phytophthora cactorum]